MTRVATHPFEGCETKHRIALGFALALAFILRYARLMSLFPVLVDEAIYLRWAQIVQHDHVWFISLLDAKPPLAYWIYAAIRTLPCDPLLGARLVSVVAGTLSVYFLFRIGSYCAGPTAGVVTALLYSVFPFGVLYDHIAYVDALVNLFGILLIYASLTCFARADFCWRRTVRLGITFGLALFTKTTILLFAFAPLAIGLYFKWRERRSLLPHLATAYAIAALFPLVSLFVVPAAPIAADNNLLVHHTSLFTPWNALVADPLLNLRYNLPLLAEYLQRYISYAALIATAVAMWVCRRTLPAVILLSSFVPFLLATALLEYYPSRYAFPSSWPCLLVIAAATAVPKSRLLVRRLTYGAAAFAFIGMAAETAYLLHAPERALQERDAEEFTGDNPYSGSGVLDAIQFLRGEAAAGPMTILTDPWWGPPTDAVFAYLNGVQQTSVFEAWWLQLNNKYPLVPAGRMPVWKSQYQRVADGEVDFSSVPRLYYITDSNYHQPDEVHALSSSAHLLQRFPKPGSQHFVDVYRIQ